ncbi:MAG TPA: prenyltransferase [Edaphocola sp.]|nr:prenyltransferase [Edaphocola sp.]
MSQTKMWRLALKGVVAPMDKPTWNKLDFLSKFLISTRASVLIMTVLSVLIAILFTIGHHQFDLFKSFILIASITLAHACNNILNDWSDWRRKVDEEGYFRSRYAVEPLTHGLITGKQALLQAAVTGGVACLGGVYLISQVPNIWFGIGLFVAGLFFLLFYTWPLKYLGLGEVAVIIVWGPLMIGGGYYMLTGNWSNEVLLAGLPYALGVTGVIFGKHIDKYEEDKKKKIHTLPVILGEKISRYVMIAVVLLQYLITTYLVFTGFFHPIMLIVWITFLGVPKLRAKIPVLNLIKTFSRPRPTEAPQGWKAWPLYFVSIAFVQNQRFGIIFLLGLIIQTAIHLIG